jgi:Type VI secretion system/phage-baseplate injector OB domain
MDHIKRLNGHYRAIVQDNKDPQNLRRLKLKVQSTGFGPDTITDWVWPVENSGVVLTPPAIGQGVWVTYIGGDPEYPVWLGTFGSTKGIDKKIKLAPLAGSTSLSGLSTYFITGTEADGTPVVDVTATLFAMANKLKNYETRISSLESQVATLHSTLATRTSPSHTHGSNG